MAERSAYGMTDTDTRVPTDMAAAYSAVLSSPPVADASQGLALYNTVQTDKAVNSALHPEQHWNGRRETLGSWLAEFETVLATVSPELHEFAVEFILSDRNKTVIFFPGQAAQLDGAMARPDFTWATPAPSTPATYDVAEHVVQTAYARLHHERCLRDAHLDPNNPPFIPPGTTYPIDGQKYVCNTAMLHDTRVPTDTADLRPGSGCRSVSRDATR